MKATMGMTGKSIEYMNYDGRNQINGFITHDLKNMVTNFDNYDMRKEVM